MDEADIFDPQKLGHRQQFAAARRQCESEPLALLAQTRQRATIRGRVEELDQRLTPARWTTIRILSVTDGRMGSRQLNDLERILSPERISETLLERELFPEVEPAQRSEARATTVPHLGPFHGAEAHQPV